MKIAVLGTGSVGEMGSRTANDEKALAWVKKSGAEQFNLKIVR